MAPTNMAVRSRRTQSYSLSSDYSVTRPLYQVPEDDDLRKSPRTKTMTTSAVTGFRTPVGGLRCGGDASGDTASRGTSRVFKPVGRKIEYDSDSCLTPRSRRTLRRTLSGVTEPWPSVSAAAAAAHSSTLGTIYSPTHEILHPMQSLLLEKKRSIVDSNKPSVSYLKGNHLAPARASQSVDFDRRRLSSPKRKTSSFKLENHAVPEPVAERAQVRDEVTVTSRALMLTENRSVTQAPKNIVVIIVDAEKRLTKFVALDWAINVAARNGDEIVILGVLKNICSPHGYKVVADTDPLTGVNQELLRSEVQRHMNIFEENLFDSGRRAECEKKNVKLTVRVAPGARARTVVVRELADLKATYAVFDRRVMRGSSYYSKHLLCHAVRMRSNGRSTKTIFTTATQMATTTTTLALTPTPPTPTWSSSSDSPTSSSDTSGSSSSSSPTFWDRFTPFKSNRNKWSPAASTASPRSSTAASSDVASSSPGGAGNSSMNMDAFMSEMQDFSVSLDRSKGGVARAGRTKLALQSCVATDAYSYKQGMESLRSKHRPMSVTLPSICAA